MAKRSLLCCLPRSWFHKCALWQSVKAGPFIYFLNIHCWTESNLSISVQQFFVAEISQLADRSGVFSMPYHIFPWLFSIFECKESCFHPAFRSYHAVGRQFKTWIEQKKNINFCIPYLLLRSYKNNFIRIVMPSASLNIVRLSLLLKNTFTLILISLKTNKQINLAGYPILSGLIHSRWKVNPLGLIRTSSCLNVTDVKWL